MNGLTKIKHVDIDLWNKYNVSFTANNDVNILVGVNGSGKTTLLSKLANTIGNEIADKDKFVYIPSIDNIPVRDRRRNNVNALTQDLEYYIYDMKTGPSLMSYRMSMIDADSTAQAATRKRINNFCDLVNGLFKDSGKSIETAGTKFIIHTGDNDIEIKDLSSGEKQMLLTLLRIFLTNERDAIVLIDEPETSLDINWQYKLIDILVKLNPNAQYFITTHSPSIFGAGWGDKITYMEDVSKSIVLRHEQN